MSDREATHRASRVRTREGAHGGLALKLTMLGIATMCFNKARVGDWAVSDLVFLLAAGVVGMKLLAGRTADLAPNAMRKTSPQILIGTLVIVMAGTVSSFQSYEPTRSVAMVVRIVWITLAWFWVLRAVSPNRSTLFALLRSVGFTVMISCAGAVAGYLGLVNLTAHNAEDREAAFFNHPNELGGLLAMALPLAVLGVLQLGSPGKRVKWRHAASVLAVVVALGTTGSMTAFVSCVAGLAAVVALNVLTLRTLGRRRFRTPLPYMGAILVLAGGLLWLSTTDLPVVERFTEFGQGDSQVSESVTSREDLNSYVLNNLDDSLIVGVGMDADTRTVSLAAGGSGAADRIHNLYLKLLYETGVPGLIGLAIILAAVVRQAWRLAINTRATELHPVVVGLFGSLVSMSVFALFQPLFAQRYYWLPIALIGVVWALRRQESSEAAELSARAGHSV